MTTTANEVLGPSVRVEDTISYLRTWFNPDDIVVVSGKPVEDNGVLSARYRVSKLLSLLESDIGSVALDTWCVDRGRRFGVYVNMSPVREEFASHKGRGTRGQVSRVIGLVADLDVKPGGFSDWESILAFLRRLELLPTMIVSSGSGGAHVYWKLDPQDSSELAVDDGKLLTDQFWSWLNKEAVTFCGASIDRLIGVERMYRLPGTIRWPDASVSLFYAGDSVVGVNRVRDLGAAPLREREHIREAIRVRERVRENNALSTEGMTWEDVIRRDSALERVSTISWKWILETAGWSWIGEDAEGRQEWARPGKPGAKSATVDWPESPDVMSLFSTAEETGLSDLLEAGIVLDKTRVLLRLLFGDDHERMIKWACT